MTKRAFRPHRCGATAWWSDRRRGGFSSPRSAAGLFSGKLAAGGPTERDAASNGSAGGDSFGEPAVAGQVNSGGNLVMALSGGAGQA